MGSALSRPPALPENNELWIMQRGRGIYTRTVAMPVWSRLFQVFVVLQAIVLIGVNITVAVLVGDCLSALILALSSMTTLFMSYFAIEAVRTENVYQLVAYTLTSIAFLTFFIPPLFGSQDGPTTVDGRLPLVKTLLRLAIIFTCSTQMLCFILALMTYCGAERVPGFGVRTYKKVGTDPQLLHCYRRYQQFCSVLKLDLLFQLQILAFALLGFQELDWRWLLTVCAHVPIAVAWLPIGLTSVRREVHTLLMLLLVAAFAQPVLYTVQLLSYPSFSNATTVADAAAQNMSHYCTQRLREHAFPFSSGLQVLYAMAIVARLLLLSATILVRESFGKGLASRVHQRAGGEGAHEALTASYSPLSPELRTGTSAVRADGGSYDSSSWHPGMSSGTSEPLLAGASHQLTADTYRLTIGSGSGSSAVGSLSWMRSATDEQQGNFSRSISLDDSDPANGAASTSVTCGPVSACAPLCTEQQQVVVHPCSELGSEQHEE